MGGGEARSPAAQKRLSALADGRMGRVTASRGGASLTRGGGVATGQGGSGGVCYRLDFGAPARAAAGLVLGTGAWRVGETFGSVKPAAL